MEKETLNKSCCESGAESTSLTKGNNLCPVCGQPGNTVKNITVKHMVCDEAVKQLGDEDYYLCMNKNCDVVYYSIELDAKFNKHQVKVPIWFKKDADPKYVCYCNKVTEKQVMDAVIKDGARNMKDVSRLTGAMQKGQCLTKNPTGNCCHKIVQEAIDTALLIQSK